MALPPDRPDGPRASRRGSSAAGESSFPETLFRELTEERLRLLTATVQAAASPILITDREGLIEWVNPAFTQTTGYTFEEAIGRNPGKLLRSGVHDRAFYDNLWRTILAGEIWRGRMVNRRKDGSLYPEEQTITPVRDARGEITHFIAVKLDVSRREELEAQLRQAQKMEVLGQLAGGVAHDFNNLLTAIGGRTALALDGLPADSPARGDLEEVLEQVERARHLARQLLGYSRKRETDPRVVDLGETVGEMEPLLRSLVPKRIDLRLTVPEEPILVTADPGQLQQVVLNLTGNAVDAIAGDGRITASVDAAVIPRQSEKRRASGIELPRYGRISVEDTGAGIPKEILSRILEPFFTTKPAGKGTGLGLSIVSGIVEAGGGFLEVDSVSGRGTAFRVLLPLVEGEAGTTGSA